MEEQIFADISRDPMQAAHKTLGYLKQDSPGENRAEKLIDAAQVLVFLKGNDAHDYKFSSAVLEDYYNISPGMAGCLPGFECVHAARFGRQGQLDWWKEPERRFGHRSWANGNKHEWQSSKSCLLVNLTIGSFAQFAPSVAVRGDGTSSGRRRE